MCMQLYCIRLLCKYSAVDRTPYRLILDVHTGDVPSRCVHYILVDGTNQYIVKWPSWFYKHDDSITGL